MLQIRQHAIESNRGNEQKGSSSKKKKKSIELRNKWMHDKTVKKYQTEYDRIRGHLDNSTTPGLTR